MEFSELIKARKSQRQYSEEKLTKEEISILLESGKLAPSSRNKKPCSIIFVDDKQILEKLSEAKASGSAMLKNAACALVLSADSSLSDVWVEDSSIVMTYLHLCATDLGLKSCWVQIRNRQRTDGSSSEVYVKELLNLEEKQRVCAILSLGK